MANLAESRIENWLQHLQQRLLDQPIGHRRNTKLPLLPFGFGIVTVSAFYPILVHRLAVSLRASFPHPVALMQLRFASFAMINLRRDLHSQEGAHAGSTMKRAGGDTGTLSFYVLRRIHTYIINVLINLNCSLISSSATQLCTFRV